MLEARSLRYAALICFALVTVGCGANLPGEGDTGPGGTSREVVGCPTGTSSSDCAPSEDAASQTPEAQCKEAYRTCLAQGRDEQACRTRFSQCMANVPPPPPQPSPEPPQPTPVPPPPDPIPPLPPQPPPPPSHEAFCQALFDGCIALGVDPMVCREKRQWCLAHPPMPPPPPPPPSPEDPCFRDFRLCYDVTGDLDACFARLKICLGAPQPPPPPPPPSEEQCRLEYRSCLAATGDEPGCRRRLDHCLANVPPPPP